MEQADGPPGVEPEFGGLVAAGDWHGPPRGQADAAELHSLLHSRARCPKPRHQKHRGGSRHWATRCGN
jgi:hypothetical protein